MITDAIFCSAFISDTLFGLVLQIVKELKIVQGCPLPLLALSFSLQFCVFNVLPPEIVGATLCSTFPYQDMVQPPEVLNCKRTAQSYDRSQLKGSGRLPMCFQLAEIVICLGGYLVFAHATTAKIRLTLHLLFPIFIVGQIFEIWGLTC